MSLIGLDVGTTGCKCTVFDDEAKITAYSYSEYMTLSPHEGYFELDPARVWESVKKVIYEAVKAHKGDSIKALAISSFGEAAVLLDKNSNILHNSILYLDKRGRNECDALRQKLGDEKIMDTAGVLAHPMYTLPKLMWIRNNLPDIYKTANKVMLFGDYISFCLTGRMVIDYSLASRTMAFDVVKKQWSEEILNASGVDYDLFSKPSCAGAVIGEIQKETAALLGLSEATVVVTGAHDQICAAVGAGVMEKGMAIDGIGSVECITTVYDKPVLNKKMMENKYNCAPYVKEGMYASYAFNFTGGSLLKWYRDTFAVHEHERAKKAGMNVYELLDNAAGETPSDLLVLPHFAGAGTPFMDTEAKGAILGLDFNTKAPAVYRAMLEGVTYEMALNLECLKDAGINIDVLRAVGGGAKSDLWLQIKADIMQRKVQRLDVDEAGTLGAAMLAGKAAGVYNSIDEAAKCLIRVKKEFYPDFRHVDKYAENYGRYKKIYKSLKNIFDT